MTLEERIKNFNQGLLALETAYGLRPQAEIYAIPVTRGEERSLEVKAQLTLISITDWKDPTHGVEH